MHKTLWSQSTYECSVYSSSLAGCQENVQQMHVIHDFSQWRLKTAAGNSLSLISPCQPAHYSAANTLLSCPYYTIPPQLLYIGFQINCKFLANCKSRCFPTPACTPFSFPSDFLLSPLSSKLAFTYYVCPSQVISGLSKAMEAVFFLLPSVLSRRFT